MGGEVEAPAVLVVQLPERPAALARVPFTEAEADTAEVRVQVC